MSQVSKRPINKKTQDRIWSLFVSCITETNNKELAEGLIRDLLTPTERIMLTKRFSISFMLLHGYVYEDIAKVLKVSTSTVNSISRWLKTEGEGLRKIISKIEKQEKRETLVSEMSFILGEHLLKAPHATGRPAKSLQVKRLINQKPF